MDVAVFFDEAGARLVSFESGCLRRFSFGGCLSSLLDSMGFSNTGALSKPPPPPAPLTGNGTATW